MSIVAYLAAAAVGAATHAAHVMVCRRAIYKAYAAGYDQAEKEARISHEAEERGRKFGNLPRMAYDHTPHAVPFSLSVKPCSAQAPIGAANTPAAPQDLPPFFGEQLDQNGFAKAYKKDGAWHA